MFLFTKSSWCVVGLVLPCGDRMYDKILVPLNGSELAEKIFPYVQALAEKFLSEVILLQVIQPSAVQYAIWPEAAVDEFAAGLGYSEERASEYLKRTAPRLRSMGMRVRSLILMGSPGTTIAGFAAQEEMSLIAMIELKESWLKRILHGDVSNIVHAKSNVPVLLVKEPGR